MILFSDIANIIHIDLHFMKMVCRESGYLRVRQQTRQTSALQVSLSRIVRQTVIIPPVSVPSCVPQPCLDYDPP